MLPIYDDITFLEVLDKGGRHKPWLVKAVVNNTYEEYVVKIFPIDQEDEHHYTASEIYGSILAREFDLKTPEIALIDFNAQNVNSLPPTQLVELEEKGMGVKFGSKYYPGSFSYTPSIHKNQIQRRIDIDTFFAFDQLINNVDRQMYKPNILFRDDGILLIDHELGFRNLTEARRRIEEYNAGNPQYEGHIAVSLLRKANKTSKQDYFNTFEELLRTMDLSILDPYATQLMREGIPEGNFAEIKSFMEFAKVNHRLFVTVLKSLVS